MSQRISWPAVAQWSALTLVGVVLAGGFHFPGDHGTLRWSQVQIGLGSGVMGFIFGAASGLMIAGLQALVLQRWGGPVRGWLAYNAVAFGAIHAVADAIPYRPLVIAGGGLILPLFQYLALRRVLSRPLAWLPLAAGAWWLGFGLTAGPVDYNLIVVGCLLGAASGLGLRLLFISSDRPIPNRRWARLGRAQRVLLGIGMVAGVAAFLVVFAALSGLIGLF